MTAKKCTKKCVLHMRSCCFANSPSSLLKLQNFLLSLPLLNGQSPCQDIPYKYNRDTVHNIQWSLTLLACTCRVMDISLCQFRPVNSWVCQNGLTCIKRSVDHSPTMTAQFRFDLRNNRFYTFIRLPVSIRTPVSLFICHSQLPVL